MVPKLIKGRGIAGCARYVLHDKDSTTTSERVAWVETRNIASHSPEVAWRVMCATAMSSARLKAGAGIKNTGRKAKHHVLHLTLAWHPDESEDLTRGEMIRAANGAIRALGAEDHQAIIAAHTDEEQPHVHVVICTVSPVDGRTLNSSKDLLKLSKWAQQYEQERGFILCDNRVINNAARDRGEYVRGGKGKPRHVYELEAANENHPNSEAIRTAQRIKDAAVAKQASDTAERHAVAWSNLDNEHKQRLTDLKTGLQERIAKATYAVRQDYADVWRALHHEHQAELKQFDRDETNFLGYWKNAARALNFGELFRRGERSQIFRKTFDVLSSSGARLEALRRQQKAESRIIQQHQNRDEQAAVQTVRQAAQSEREAVNRRYLIDRAELMLNQAMDAAAIRAAWRQRSKDRRHAWKHGHEIDRDFGPTGTQTILPNKQIKKNIASFKEMMKKRKLDRLWNSREKRHDDDRGRDGR